MGFSRPWWKFFLFGDLGMIVVVSCWTWISLVGEIVQCPFIFLLTLLAYISGTLSCCHGKLDTENLSTFTKF